MSGRSRPVPDNQLTLIGLEPAPSKEQKPKRRKPGLTRRTDDLEKRVTNLEAEVTLLKGQLEIECDDER